ncbi:hypothetical protein HYPDE_23853 [Hyphomicrobium denitrificans 1NES1]|uniref:Stringent starvation protein B n=1 Tax=Hyphomicrobium denitrificans 1NES1 TaxID=670307 RepID=N0B7E6_9HYPH|nr:ClpXP protease specificity-enhancing factor SspB [Hyphomicrobium denitrificans]AGK56456.1 hypothetical protein HYPDE_23853 [Hyphomicrobium denitrificans 1NES1]
MATGPSIDYAKLQQEAMRGVVRAVLQQVVKSGLPGEHHFYISFLTQAPGVILSKRLKEKYPSEMTIVLQHRFWDLIVSDDRFEVKLTFDGIPERLVVPFAAIKVFIDPSVRYGLQFDEEVSDNEPMHEPRQALTADATYDQIGEASPESARPTPKKPRAPRKPRATDKDATSPTRRDPAHAMPPSPEPATRAGELNAKNADSADETPPPPEGAKILSLDQFRKK